MILSDREIREEVENGRIGIDPLPEEIQYQPASLDLRLGTSYTDENTGQVYENSRVLQFEPHTFHLSETLETITIPPEYCAFVSGRSSIAREGLIIHSVAGWCDPGFSGTITLEIYNLNKNRTLEFEPGTRIGQIIFMKMSEVPEIPYGDQEDSKYQNQSGPTRSRFDQEEEPTR